MSRRRWPPPVLWILNSRPLHCNSVGCQSCSVTSKGILGAIPLKKGISTKSRSRTLHITIQRCHTPLLRVVLRALNAAAIARQPLRPVPAPKHTTVLKCSGFAGVKYGPSNLNSVSARRASTPGHSEISVPTDPSLSSGCADLTSSSTKEPNLFVHCVAFFRGVVFDTLALNRNCTGMEWSSLLSRGFFDARWVMVVNGWISRIEDCAWWM